jgi:glutathione synthase
MKPLDGYGGRGVIVVEKSAMDNIKSLLEFYINKSKTESNYVILQEYVEGAEKGDVRVLMLNGKPIGALRRIPAKGDIRSNISAGGSVEKYKLTKKDKEMCAIIGKKLVKDGVFFAGLDIINGKLIEINVLSPGTIADINKLNNVKLQEDIVNYLEVVVSGIKLKKEKFNPELIYEDIQS